MVGSTDACEQPTSCTKRQPTTPSKQRQPTTPAKKGSLPQERKKRRKLVCLIIMSSSTLSEEPGRSGHMNHNTSDQGYVGRKLYWDEDVLRWNTDWEGSTFWYTVAVLEIIANIYMSDGHIALWVQTPIKLMDWWMLAHTDNTCSLVLLSRSY